MCSQNPVVVAPPTSPVLKLQACAKDAQLATTVPGHGGSEHSCVLEHSAQDLKVEYVALCAKMDAALKNGASAEHLRKTAQTMCCSPDMPVFSRLPESVCGTLWRLALAQAMFQNCSQEIQEIAETSDGSGGPHFSSISECGASEFTDATSCCGDSPQASLTEAVSTDVPELSMRKHLQSLQDEDQRCILLLRDIQKLGFSPQALLMSHFSNFGPVKQIMVARSATNGARKRSRIRPAGLGFVVMENAEAAAAILDQGERQVIQGTAVEVRIRSFQHASSEKSGCLKSNTWADISGF